LAVRLPGTQAGKQEVFKARKPPGRELSRHSVCQTGSLPDSQPANMIPGRVPGRHTVKAVMQAIMTGTPPRNGKCLPWKAGGSPW
jgi:hypothetical protein